MPDHLLVDAKRRLRESCVLLDAKLDALATGNGEESIRGRILIARESIRDSIARVEHVEEAISDAQPRPPTP